MLNNNARTASTNMNIPVGATLSNDSRMTRALAMEVVGHGVTVNALCPGYVDTGMTARTIEALVNKMGGTRDDALAALVSANPQGRLIDPEELADTALWLCLPTSASVTGQAVAISGGEIM